MSDLSKFNKVKGYEKMKKNLSFLISVLLVTFTLTTNAKASELVIGAITDDSNISTDLKQLDIEYTDYFTIKNTEYNYKNYFEYFVLAVAENRIAVSNTDVYLYIYNPIYVENVAINIDMTINQDFKVSSDYRSNTAGDFTLCSRSDNNILKLKYEYNNFYPDRNYEIIVKDVESGIASQRFTSTMTTSDNGRLVETTYNFNSMLYVAKDQLIELEFEDWDTSNWWQSICHEFNLFKDEEKVLMYFYNFSSSKTIDKILEVDLKYDHYNYISTAYYDPATGSRLRTLSDAKENEVKGYQVTKTPGTHKQSVYGTECTFNAFTTPASDRIKEFGNAIEVSPNLFDYDHSILVDINKAIELYSVLKTVPKKEVFPLLQNDNSRTQVLEKKINAYSISSLKMTRLKYSAGGKIYNSYVLDDMDDPIPVKPGNPKLEDSNWKKFIKWFMDNFPWSGLLVIGIPLILIVLAIFFPQVLVTVIKGFISVIDFIIRIFISIIQTILDILLFPFRLIIGLFRKRE